MLDGLVAAVVGLIEVALDAAWWVCTSPARRLFVPIWCGIAIGAIVGFRCWPERTAWVALLVAPLLGGALGWWWERSHRRRT